ncbi:MAG: hypothetical protein JRF23_01700 [Deltaproteobacteria bacterium]|nr:hypothetical protein [Deltaproteobacteria bacterium]
MNGKQKLVVVAMDLLLIAELGFSIHHGAVGDGDLTMVFLKSFVPAAILTVVGARFLIRRLQTATTAADPQARPPAAR